ncbi:MAG: hypothetical protein AAF149_13490 [Bacteroidota bacterium]
MKIGIVTCEAYPNLSESDQFLLKDLTQYNVKAKPMVWSSEADWTEFDALLIRSVWDYHKRYYEFVSWLHHIKQAGIPTQNSIELMMKNSDKTYLKSLEQSGISIVPTEILSTNTTEEIGKKMDRYGWNKAVLKPTISATAYHTHLISSTSDLDNLRMRYDLNYLLQPYMPEIEKGEHSLVFLNGEFSHAVLKKPKPNDFRVQSDFGGSYQLVEVDPEIVKQAKKVVSLQPELPLYARVDGLVLNDQFLLMEIELIEPELFLLNLQLKDLFIHETLKVF